MEIGNWEIWLEVSRGLASQRCKVRSEKFEVVGESNGKKEITAARIRGVKLGRPEKLDEAAKARGRAAQAAAAVAYPRPLHNYVLMLQVLGKLQRSSTQMVTGHARETFGTLRRYGEWCSD